MTDIFDESGPESGGGKGAQTVALPAGRHDDSTRPKAGLARLKQGDVLAFYAGLEGWGRDVPAGLYLVGYFVVEWAALATSASEDFVRKQFAQNFHVMHEDIYVAQRQRLVLVKGGTGGRLLEKAHLISAMATNRSGQPLKVLSLEAQCVFGDFGGHISIQRSPPRWVDAPYADRAKAFLNSFPQGLLCSRPAGRCVIAVGPGASMASVGPPLR